MKNNWTTPKVKSFPLESGKDWYVWFRFNGVLKFVKTGINKIPDYTERLEETNALADVLKDKLQKGWIPTKKEKEVEKITLLFNNALDFGLEKKKPSISEKTYLDYRCTVRFFKSSAKRLDFDRINIANCERFHVKSIMDDLQQQKKWTAKNYNKHIGYIKSIFSELVEWEQIKSNVVRDIRMQKEEKTEGYIQLTHDEHVFVFAHLKEIDFHYYIFCSMEYDMGIRPKELLLLKCGDVDLKNGIVKVGSGASKNKKTRFVPIIGNTKNLLENFDLSNSEYYLFGRPKPYGAKFFKHEYFCPKPYSIRRTTATNKWKKYVIDGLGISKHLYSLKHKGGNDKLKAGLDIKTISEIFGHSTEKMTEIYANHINDLRFAEAKKVDLKIY